MESLYIYCPHCKSLIEILEINCSIFRHGIFKNNYIQINPHSSQELCQYYIDNDLIYGCGKPFKLVLNNDKYDAIACDYI